MAIVRLIGGLMALPGIIMAVLDPELRGSIDVGQRRFAYAPLCPL